MDRRIMEYRDMLIAVAECVNDEQLKKMKFRCDFIKMKEREKITSALDLWSALEQRTYLGQSNLQFLRELLHTCMEGKTDAVNIVDHYMRGGTVAYQQAGAPYNPGFHNCTPLQAVPDGQFQHRPYPARPRYEGPDLNKEILFLSRNLGRDWKFFVRALGMEEEDIDNVMYEHRLVREQIHQCLKNWQYKEQQNASRNKFVAALRDPSVMRFDLAAKLEDGAI